MVRTQIQLTEAEARALRRLAAERSTSLAALVREGIALLLRARRQVSQEEIRRRASAVVGRFRSGTGDLADHHDDYFAEAAQR
jgi:hypothetical protein